MSDPGGMDVQIWATLLLVLVSLGTVMMAYLMLRVNVDPHVVVYVKHDDDRPTLFMIVIANVGRGAAYDVRFGLDRPISGKAWGIEKGEGEPAPMAWGPLMTGIPLLAPGERRVIDWGQYGGLSDVIGDRPIRVHTTYESRRMRGFDPTLHETESVLEVESFYKTNATGSVEHELVRKAGAIADELRKLNAQAGDLVRRLPPPE